MVATITFVLTASFVSMRNCTKLRKKSGKNETAVRTARLSKQEIRLIHRRLDRIGMVSYTSIDVFYIHYVHLWKLFSFTESVESQVHRRRRVEPNESSATGSTSSASVNVPQISPTRRAVTAQANQNHPQPSTSRQMGPPAPRQRNFAAKSTGGRPQKSTAGPLRSKPGPLSSKNTQSQSSSELVPSYENPSPISNASVRNSLPRSHSDVSNAALPSPNVEGPTAPIPKKRYERNQRPRNISPQRRNESNEAFNKRLQEAHRTFYREGGG